MIDLLMLILMATAFAGAVGYVEACARLTTHHRSATDKAS